MRLFIPSHPSLHYVILGVMSWLLKVEGPLNHWDHLRGECQKELTHKEVWIRAEKGLRWQIRNRQ